MTERIARNCANWTRRDPVQGVCNSCGVQWQYCEVGSEYPCPQFASRGSTIADSDGDDGS